MYSGISPDLVDPLLTIVAGGGEEARREATRGTQEEELTEPDSPKTVEWRNRDIVQTEVRKRDLEAKLEKMQFGERPVGKTLLSP